jgi:hypothetical protein
MRATLQQFHAEQFQWWQIEQAITQRYGVHACVMHDLSFSARDRDEVQYSCTVFQCAFPDGGVCDFGIGTLQHGTDLLVIQIRHACIGLNRGRADLEDAVGGGVGLFVHDFFLILDLVFKNART